MSTSRILNSFEIHDFRAFSNLRIERLGRVNLIVGKNNVGKTSLLEALWLYASRGSQFILWQILEERDEGVRPLYVSELGKARSSEIGDARILGVGGTTDRALAVRHIFHGRANIKGKRKSIYMGPVDSPEGTLSISVDWYSWQIDEQRRITLKPLASEETTTAYNPVPVVIVGMDEIVAIYRLDNWFDSPVYGSSAELEVRCIFVSSDGMASNEVGRLWDSIALTDMEADVIKALSIIAPQVERISLVSNQQVGEDWEPIPIVKLKGYDDPIPLLSLGEGMVRLFGIALALVNAKDGILLIDEIESGIHYSVQPDVWRLVFDTAQRLNVQVFATTHSWDCIAAFQQAAEENKDEEGILIRLENRKGKIVATEFDERRLGIATREEIEVR